MAKKERNLSLSYWLYQLGSRIRFRPQTTFSTVSEEEKSNRLDALNFRLLGYKKKGKNAFAKSAEQSVLLSFARKGIDRLMSLGVRSFGVLFFSCGFLQILSYFLSVWVSFLPGGEERFLFGAALVFLALFCSFSRDDLGTAVEKSFFFRGILRPALDLRDREEVRRKRHDSIAWMFLAGAAFGVLSALVSPILILRFLFCFLGILLLFSVPEAGLLVFSGGILLFSVTEMTVLVLLTALAFLFKCGLGKRSMAFAPMDLILLLFLFPVCFLEKNGGVFVFLALFFAYFLISCLLRTVNSVYRWFAVMAGMVSLAAFLLILSEVLLTFFPTMYYEFPRLRWLFFLEPTGETGVLFAMFAPLLQGKIRSSPTWGRKLVYLVALLLVLGAVFTVRSSVIWFSLILGMCIFILFTYRSALIWILSLALISVTALQVFPPEGVRAFLRHFGVGDSVLSFDGSGEIGLMRFFRQQGTVFWCILFLALLAFLVFEALRFVWSATNERIFPLILGVLSSAAVLFFLSVQTVMPDLRALFLLSVLCAIPRASYRCSKREEIFLPY